MSADTGHGDPDRRYHAGRHLLRVLGVRELYAPLQPFFDKTNLPDFAAV
jgi:hypothetical protein